MAATMKDIATKTGLGLATISKYINGGTVKGKNRIAIDQAVKELNFTVNEYARGLKTNHSKTVGVIIPDFRSVFSMSIVSVIEDILRGSGYSTIICDCRSDPKMEAETVSFLINKKIDGIISIPVSNDGEYLNVAKARDIPIILIDRKISGLDCDSVLIDNVKAAGEATGMLLGGGHTKIAIICGPQDVFTSQQRLLGYRQALLEKGIMPDESFIAYGNNTIQSGFETMKSLIEGGNKITALFVTNYEMTLGAIIALNELGWVIPGDLSVIGFDNLELAMVIKPRLTIVSQPIQEIGEQAAGLLLGRMLGTLKGEPRTVKLYTAIIEGESVKKL